MRPADLAFRIRLWPKAAGVGQELPLLVPQVDADGNDLGGIRMPDVGVPLGSCTGWVFRATAIDGRREMVPLRGSWIPFAATREQRKQVGDPRLSLKERYASCEAYLARVNDSLEQLVRQGYLLAEDLDPLRTQAKARWDWVMGQKPGDANPGRAARPGAHGWHPLGTRRATTSHGE